MIRMLSIRVREPEHLVSVGGQGKKNARIVAQPLSSRSTR
jgi:hypothetical protein